MPGPGTLREGGAPALQRAAGTDANETLGPWRVARIAFRNAV